MQVDTFTSQHTIHTTYKTHTFLIYSLFYLLLLLLLHYYHLLILSSSFLHNHTTTLTDTQTTLSHQYPSLTSAQTTNTLTTLHLCSNNLYHTPFIRKHHVISIKYLHTSIHPILQPQLSHQRSIKVQINSYQRTCFLLY